MKQATEGSMGGRHGAQVSEGAKGGRHGAQVTEGHKATGKSNGPEATLRSGSKPSGNALGSFGLKQSPHEEAPSGESNHETRRFGNKPAAEKVRHAKLDTSVQKKAHGFNERSQKGGAEKGGGW